MSETAIKFENISKEYRLGLVSTRTLSHDLNRWWQVNVRGKEDPYLKIGEVNDRATKGNSEYVWALRDINFEVKKGDVLGIIGKNGAGKSTLLKILSKVTTPSTGSIKAKGRIASLLEVGTGFHPEMTGRENIYMNGAIMGMTKVEITRKLDEIVDFAGVERYLDTPVKRYSSGMTVRLGFAIAAHLEPEILVVDEVLAVGDAEFQKKAIGKMKDVSRGEGRTVLFVSHNMSSLKAFCDNGLLLENGVVSFSGSIINVVEKYLQSTHLIDLSNNMEWEGSNAPGSNEIKIRKAYFINEGLCKVNVGYVNELLGLTFEYDVLYDIPYFTHSINIFNSEDVHVFTSHDNNEYLSSSLVCKGKYKTTVWIYKNLLQEGEFVVSFACMRYNPFTVLFHELNILKIHVLDSKIDSSRNFNYTGELPGIVRPRLDWINRIKLD